MNKSRLALCVFLVAIAFVVSNAQSMSSQCTACNCQINNIEILDQLVEAKVNQILVNEPSKLSLQY